MSKQKRTFRDGRGAEGTTNFSGQHLLVDGAAIGRIVALAQSRAEGDRPILDIGAGKGALTVPMAERGWRVLAVENDPAMAEKLRAKLGDKPNVRIVERNALDMRLPREPFGVVANIPFAITTRLFDLLLGTPASSFEWGVFVVERGAAYRFTADPVTDPRLLGWRMRYDLKMTHTISRDSFAPRPRVDAAVLCATRRKRPLVPDGGAERFLALAAHGLREPRLPLFEALGDVFTAPQLKVLCRALGGDRNAAIGTLDEKRWAIVYETMCRYADRSRWPRRVRRK
ncbi:ribosomal RNA small subunit methyltransferase A [Paenibacillus flagellatus]|uniref:rRNA adenine N-6-methyltransferase n=1 Tax=Paenibacillus flagellatus TaxID=2211139 RepID=A0A2V5JYZ3_9BACL|nr:rRNA adenine N(6)-methyltransferase family protein [Paenibacillus flagellatus]PYI50514.1 rRNA adenine methyltransferase [Paenibacillus flagellatus]